MKNSFHQTAEVLLKLEQMKHCIKDRNWEDVERCCDDVKDRLPGGQLLGWKK